MKLQHPIFEEVEAPPRNIDNFFMMDDVQNELLRLKKNSNVQNSTGTKLGDFYGGRALKMYVQQDSR